VNEALELMRNEKIDYIMDAIYLSSEILHPDITSLSTGIRLSRCPPFGAKVLLF
jgi:hypothetical protein